MAAGFGVRNEVMSKELKKQSAIALKQLRALKSLGKEMRLAADGWNAQWKTLIAILMSARTRDEVTILVGEKLFAKYKTVGALASASRSDLEKLIRPINFFRTKSKSVLGCANALQKYFGGEPPHDIKKLVSLPGVGRKTANVFLSQYGADALGVDTHVSHISRALGWTKHAHPEKIEKDLENIFPQSAWKEVNAACVHFGKTFTKKKEKSALLDKIKKLTL